MTRSLLAAVFALLIAGSAQAQPTPAEEPVDPYEMSNANAGAEPFAGDRMWGAFHGEAGVRRIVDETVDRSLADERISDIFKAHDMARLRRTLREQFCYVLGGGCDYTGRSMQASHKDLGLQNRDMGILVEHLQVAMSREKVAFAAQNRFLAKLAPMRRDVVVR